MRLQNDIKCFAIIIKMALLFALDFLQFNYYLSRLKLIFVTISNSVRRYNNRRDQLENPGQFETMLYLWKMARV